MLQLPVELRRLCVDNLHDDGETLKALRLANKELGTLATESLFQRAILNHTDESADKFVKLIQSPLNPLMRHVVVNTSDDPEYSGGGQDAAEVAETFGEAIVKMTEFQNLEEMELKYAQECAMDPDRDKDVAETNEFRVQVMDFVLTALRRAEKLKTLTIKNLQDYHGEIFEGGEFAMARSRLTKLHLQIANECDDASPENTIDYEALHDGFTRSLPLIWLKPLTHQLTHLTLYGGECLWGVWPFVDFREIPPFPHLKSLSLGNFVIAHDWQMDWIVAHSATLRQLILDDCSIPTTMRLTEQQATPNFPNEAPFRIHPYAGKEYFVHVALRWHNVFDRMRIGLPRLHHFAMGHGDWNEGKAFEERYELANSIEDERYCMFDWGIGPSQWIMYSPRRRSGYCFSVEQDELVPFPQCKDEDQRALVKLLEVVEARAGTKV